MAEVKAVKITIPFVRKHLEKVDQANLANNEEELIVKRLDEDPPEKVIEVTKHIPLPPGIDYAKFNCPNITYLDEKIFEEESKQIRELAIAKQAAKSKKEEDKEQWLARAMKRNTEILALYERVRPISKAPSFATHIMKKYSKFSSKSPNPANDNVSEQDSASIERKPLDFQHVISTTEDRGVISRESLIQIIHQHLATKQFWKSIDCLGKESGVKYNGSGKDAEISYLQTLLQMGIKNAQNMNKLPNAQTGNLEIDNEVQTASIFNHLDPDHVTEMKNKLWDEISRLDEDNLECMEDNKTIRAATLNKLVEKLTDHASNDPKFLKTFLCTYRSFTVPEMFLAKLLERYQVPDIPIDQNIPEEEWKKIKFQIQLRTGNVIQKWIDDYFQLDWNQQMIHMLSNFIDDFLLRNKQTAKMGKTIFAKLNRKLTSGADTSEQIFSSEPPAAIVPRTIFSPKLDLFDVHETEMARQLTIREYEMYKLIEPAELLNLAWSKDKLKHRAPHVIEITNRFNILSNWASVQIVSSKSLRDRKNKFAKIVNLAKECYKLNNFNSMKAILAGLENAAVHRLKFTKDELGNAVNNEIVQMITVTSSERSFKALRSHILSCSPPLVPFLGVYLTDLTFIEDGNPDFSASKKNKEKTFINWTKRKLVFNVISEIQQYQYKPYNLQKVFQIQQALDNTFKSHSYVNDPEMFAMSLEREPRGAEKNSLVQ